MYVEDSNMVISGSSDSTIRIWKIGETATRSGTPKTGQQGADSDQEQETQPQQREEQSKTPPPQQIQRTKSFITSQRSTKTGSNPTTTPTQTTKKHTFVKDFFRSKK